MIMQPNQKEDLKISYIIFCWIYQVFIAKYYLCVSILLIFTADKVVVFIVVYNLYIHFTITRYAHKQEITLKVQFC